jgi:hypothetical protein
MATVDGSGHWRGSANPFPPAAVAHISDLRTDVLTIKTAAVREVDRLVDSYLRVTRVPEGTTLGKASAELSDTGKVYVIEGDYGTGKTHLAIEVLDRVNEADTPVFYHVVPGGTFLTLYTDLMSREIGSVEVLGRVREFYADIVADTLRGRPFTEQLVGQLERGDAEPQLVIDRYGLKEGALREALRQRLNPVTRDETFSRALMLLLQPELRDLAWDWFIGGGPSQVLVERGIAKPIQTDVQALEALGVIARLYGRNNRRFVLVVDELEKLVLAWDRSDNAKSQAFKKMLEVFHGAGALLVVCGLPDMFAVLPKDPDRIDAIIHPSLLTDEDVRWYVEETQDRVYGRRVIQPFSDESIKYLVYLTGGVARDVLRFCYYAYEYASDTGQEITASVVNSVARSRPRNGGVEMVRSEVGRLLSEQGWSSDRYRVIGAAPRVTADFWIPWGEQGVGCAVLVSDSVLEESHASRLSQRLAAIKSAAAGVAVILVVSGYLPARLRQMLLDALAGDALIVHSTRTFDNDFSQALNAAITRIGPASGETREATAGGIELHTLHAETERIARQQGNTLRLMQELSARAEERLNAIQRTLETASWLPGAEGRAGAASLPAEVEEMFSAAQQSLAAYGDVREFVDETFEIAAQMSGARFSLTHRLREPDAFGAIGVAAFLSDLLTSFRASVRNWLGTLGSAHVSGEGPTASERERLRGICRAYDALYVVTPVFKLDPLPEMTSLVGSDQETQYRARRSVRREALRSALDGLGNRVFHTAIDAAGGPAGDAAGGVSDRPGG